MSEEGQTSLPTGFKRLEYIQSSGIQFLNLPITTKAGDKVVLETECKFYDTSNQADGKNGNPNFFFGIRNKKWYCGAGSYSESSVAADAEWHKFRLMHSQDDTGLYIDDNKIQSQKYNSSSILLNGTICVYKTFNSTFYSKSAKKNWKLFVNDELIYDLVPCLDDNNVACMYDLVSTQAFYNEGTGRFIIEKDFGINKINNNYNLPAGFKKCVYLQSDGSQWINTNHIPNSETGLYFKALHLSYGTKVPFGVEESDVAIFPTRFYNKKIQFKWGSSLTTLMQWDKGDDLFFTSSINLYNSRLVFFNSDDSSVQTMITSSTTFSLNNPIWLFSYNSNGSFNTNYGKWIGRIYRAQITQGESLIHDFVPCLDANGRPCMYDILGVGDVENNTYYNQSEGADFTYCVEHQLPSDFVKLKYLESTGTQIIKTGIIPSDASGIYVDAYHTKYNDNTKYSVIGLRATKGNTYFVVGYVQRDTNEASFGWGTQTTPGGTGNCRYEATLNYLNDRQSVITAPAFAQRINNLNTLPFSPTNDLYMFGMNNYDGAETIYSTYRIYRAKISENDQIVRDYIPAFDDLKQKPCMYDLINNVAYYNDGEGEFLTNRDFEGTYTGFGVLGGIGNRLGTHGFMSEE